MEFRVIWKIEIEAATFDEAAEEALEIMRDPVSEATFFEVIRLADGAKKDVDALKLDKDEP